ncbi:YceI family protein [candidate division KSB1 bacterium]|nr:YceI family protein [candidate division KSB1 bacterium]
MKFRSFILFSALLLMSSAIAQTKNPCNPCSKTGTVFQFNDQMGRNTVTFKSQAPLEDIIGTSNQISGHIAFDPQHPEKGGHGEFTVSVASLNTGIPLRDEHLRSADWLDASAYPNVKLEIKEAKNLKPVKVTNESATYDATLVADFTLRGKTKRLEIPGRLTYLKESDLTKTKLPGNLLAARASFDVNLSDFGVTGPKGMGIIGTKVGETISVEASLVGTSAAGTMAENPCGGKAQNPCGGKAKNPCNPCGGKKKKP